VNASPLNIDKFLTLIATRGYRPKGMRNRVYRVGVELEGGWTELPRGVELFPDSSVKIKPPQNEVIYARQNEIRRLLDVTRTDASRAQLRTEYETLNYKLCQLHTGEIPSEPLELDKLPTWMKKYYPPFVNETCGLHVHMSFVSAYHYARLMIPEYSLTIVKYLTDWAVKEGLPTDHVIWPRLRGECEYCQPVFDPDRQKVKVKKEYDHHAPGNRYSMVNYQWTRLGTIEVRVLPMMATAEQGIRAVQRVIDITNASLACQREREKKFRSEVIVDPSDTFREERVERI